MNHYQHSKASLFLMEIMLNILFFTILATICLQLFVKAHNLSESTTILHKAVSCCTSIAEIYQSGQGLDGLSEIYPSTQTSDTEFSIYYDDTFATCDKKDGIYCARLYQKEDSLHTLTISFIKVENLQRIYTLEVSGYEPDTLTRLSGGEKHE